MKYLFSLALIVNMLIFTLACNKSNTTINSPASLNIINAISNSQPVIPVLGTTGSIQYFSATTVSYGTGQLYSPISGPNSIYIVQGTDTANPKLRLFNGTLDLAAGDIYSFFVGGDTTNTDTLFVQDHIPVHNDSTTGVRFVNLSPGSGPISITLDGNPASQTEFDGLGYKKISSFKTYPANLGASGSQYVFVIRDQATGDSLTSYFWNGFLFKNNTIVISGSEDPASSTPLMLFQVNNY